MLDRGRRITMSTNVSIEGLDRVLQKLGRFETLRILEEPMERSLVKIENVLKEYPDPPAPGEWAAKTHPAQKRAYFALLRAGLIKPGRTGTLGRRWTHAITMTNEGMEGRVGNNTTYGPFVQSKRFQARFHRGRWKTDEEAIQELRDEIIRDFEDTAHRAVQD